MKIQVVIDTREQRPLDFSDEVDTRREALPVADYSLVGMVDQVAIERKSLDDLLGSITRERDRFIRELRQLRSFRLAVLLIEARWPDILAGLYRSQVHPNAVIGSLMAFAIKYGVVPVLADDHATASQLCERILVNYARMVEKDWRALSQAGEPAPAMEEAVQ